MHTATCKKCSHVWIPRKPGDPKRCPQCKLWHPLRDPMIAKCECGAEWSPRVPQPRRCMDCARPNPKVSVL